jgi:hypothetical protein
LKLKRKTPRKIEAPKGVKREKKRKVSNIEFWKQELMMCQQIPEQMMVLKGWTKEELEENIADLEQKIGYSLQGTKAKRKGSTYERRLAKAFFDKWGVKLVRTPSSGGFQKESNQELIRGDLSCLDPNIDFMLHAEAKNHKTWNLKKWFKQSEEDCPPRKIPVVLYHKPQVIKDGKRIDEADDFVMIRLTDFLEIADKKKVIRRK